MQSKQRLSLAALVVAATGVLASAPAWSANSVINVKLWDKPDAEMQMGMAWGKPGTDRSNASMGIDVSSTTVKAGKVTFDVTNTSTDMVHEMIVAPIKDGEKKLPFDPSADRVKEEQAGHLGEVSELDPGKSGSLTVDLKPGEYILYCNQPAHFDGGMWTIIHVVS